MNLQALLEPCILEDENCRESNPNGSDIIN